MILFVIFAPFRFFLLFLLISIILLCIHPTREYGKDDKNFYAASKIRKIDETLSIISFIAFCITIIFAIICLFYYINF